jgi:hypothetical protein
MTRLNTSCTAIMGANTFVLHPQLNAAANSLAREEATLARPLRRQAIVYVTLPRRFRSMKQSRQGRWP